MLYLVASGSAVSMPLSGETPAVDEVDVFVVVDVARDAEEEADEAKESVVVAGSCRR